MKDLFFIENNEVFTDSKRLSKFLDINHGELIELILDDGKIMLKLGRVNVMYGLNLGQSFFILSQIKKTYKEKRVLGKIHFTFQQELMKYTQNVSNELIEKLANDEPKVNKNPTVFGKMRAGTKKVKIIKLTNEGFCKKDIERMSESSRQYVHKIITDQFVKQGEKQ